GIAALVKRDIQALLSADLKPTRGDIRCVINGHLIRLAIWRLRGQWEAALPVATKLELVTKELAALGGPSKVEEALGADYSKAPFAHDALVFEDAAPYGVEDDEVSF
ncbi:MAG: DNA methylase, partial [Acidobacteriota bacterium]